MSAITLPGLTFGAIKDTKSGTSGRNPWVDGVFYEAQWGNAIDTAFRINKPRYDYYFLKPEDLKSGNFFDESFETKIEAKSTNKEWLADKGFRGIARPHPNSSRVFEEAFRTVSDVTTLQFQETTNFAKAEAVIANAYLNGFLGSHESMINGETGGPSSLPLIFDYNHVDYQQDLQTANIKPGSNLRVVLIHELGHGLGLSHPHDSGLGFQASGVFPGLVPSDTRGNYGHGLQGLTQQPYTIMSYKRGYTNPTITDGREQSLDNTATPMALDVAALQIKYGTNRQTRKGNTTYKLSPDYWQCIYDAGGKDWVIAKTQRDEAGNPRDAIINLRPAEMNAVRPSDGSPMESYEFGHGEALDAALTTLISYTTSIIGAPLGMGVVAAGKIAHILNNRSTLKLLKKERLFQQFEKFGKSLKQLQDSGISPLQIVTAIHQTDFAENFYRNKKENEQRINLSKKHNDILNSLSDMSYLFRSIIAPSGNPNNKQAQALYEAFYVNSFADKQLDRDFPERSSDSASSNTRRDELNKRMATYESNLKEEQQSLLTRSFNGIGGYPMFYSGRNGGLTIAAGVLIENAKGSSGNDMITGNAEANILKGGRGDDVLDGYIGGDKLHGGPGSDTFSYADVTDSPIDNKLANTDLIVDFSPEDSISLKPLRMKLNSSRWNPRLKALEDGYQFSFEGSEPFSGEEGSIRFQNQQLTVDINGDKNADMMIRMSGVESIDPSQLVL